VGTTKKGPARLLRRISAVAVGLGLATAGVLVATDPAEAQSSVIIGSGNSVLGIAYEDGSFGGASLVVTSVNTGCTGPISDMDFTIAVMPAGWNDEISSARGFGGGSPLTICYWKFWRDGINAGDSIGYAPVFDYVGDNFNDAASAGALS